jgi:hypothetical protein
MATNTPNELVESVRGQLSQERVRRISDRIGADPERTSTAIDEALPMLLGALGAEAQDPDAAPGLRRALTEDHDGTLLDQLDDYLDGNVSGRQADGNGILEHVLGDRRPAAEQALASKSGLDLSSIGPLLVTLAPIVMNMLGRRQQHSGGGLGLDDLLGSLLGGGSSAATGPRSQAQGLDDLLGSMLGGSRSGR